MIRFENVTKYFGERKVLSAVNFKVERGETFVSVGFSGAGKTQLIKGIGCGLGVPPEEPVVSPTFVLVREYVGRLKLYHLDAYRLSGAAELLALGLEEMVADAGAVVALEWADRVAEAIPADACRIELEHVGENVRRIHVAWSADRLRELPR